MKAQLFKKGRVVLPIFLAMVLITAGVIGISGAANAAAKGTTYTVTLGDGSVGETQMSMSNSPAIGMTSTLTGSFQMIVDAKGGFVIPKKTFQLTQTMSGIAEGYVSTMTIKKDVKGKLGTGGTVTGVLDAKKLKVKMGKKGPAGSLTAVMDFDTVTKGPDGSVIKMKQQITFTTSNATVSGKGTKGSGLEGKSISGTGAPLDLNAGTGKLVGIGGSMKMKSAGGGKEKVQAGLRDEMDFETWVLQIKK